MPAISLMRARGAGLCRGSPSTIRRVPSGPTTAPLSTTRSTARSSRCLAHSEPAQTNVRLYSKTRPSSQTPHSKTMRDRILPHDRARPTGKQRRRGCPFSFIRRQRPLGFRAAAGRCRRARCAPQRTAADEAFRCATRSGQCSADVAILGHPSDHPRQFGGSRRIVFDRRLDHAPRNAEGIGCAAAGSGGSAGTHGARRPATTPAFAAGQQAGVGLGLADRRGKRGRSDRSGGSRSALRPLLPRASARRDRQFPPGVSELRGSARRLHEGPHAGPARFGRSRAGRGRAARRQPWSLTLPTTARQPPRCAALRSSVPRGLRVLRRWSAHWPCRGVCLLFPTVGFAEEGADAVSPASLSPTFLGGPERWTSPEGLSSTLQVLVLLTRH